MAKRESISITDLANGFGAYLKDQLQEEGATYIEDIRNNLNTQVPLSEFRVRITYTKDFKEKSDPNREQVITLAALYDFHRTGRFGEYNICPPDTSYTTLKARKNGLPNTYVTGVGIRPLQNDITQWNGSMVIDADIRSAVFKQIGLDPKKIDNARNARFAEVLTAYRKELHARLCKYPWYLWSAFSSTFGGVHIRTKTGINNLVDAFQGFLQTIYPNRTTTHLCAQMLFHINALHKWVLCYDEMLAAGRIFNEAYHMGDNYEWVAKALDPSGLRFTQGMCVMYDPALELNPGFKEMPLLLDLMEEPFSSDAPLVRTGVLKPFLSNANPLKYEPKEAEGAGGKASVKELSEEERSEMERIVSELEGIDLETFREAERECDRLGYARNELYWRVVNYLYAEFTGGNKELTLKISLALFDPQSHHSNREQIAKKIESFEKNPLKVNSLIRSLMTQVLYERIWRRGVESDRKLFEIHFDEQNTYRLKENEYVGDYIHRIDERLAPGQSLLLVSGTGTGKTEGILHLVFDVKDIGKDTLMGGRQLIYKRTKKKMLIIEPLISIVQSKFSHIPRELVQLVYGTNEDRDKNIPLCVAVIDKVISSISLGTYDTPRFDYIVVDESHLLTMSEYRQKCGLLLDFLTTQHTRSKVIYMTGTPLVERKFLPENTLCVKLDKPSANNKLVNIYTKYASPLEQMKLAIAKRIEEGKKVICIIRNKNQIRGIQSRVEELLQREIKSDRFFSDARDTPLAQNIISNKRLGDVELAFVTSVFSCGVDIEGEHDAVIYTYQELNGIEVDQYANRLRKTDIEFNMYGRYRNRHYRGLDRYVATPKDNIDVLLPMLNDTEQERHTAEAMLAHKPIPYLVKDRFDRYTINDTLLELHKYYRAWDGWSRQWQVCAQYLRGLGYTVDIDPRTSVRLERELDMKEVHRIRTKHRNEQYRRFMEIWTEHAAELHTLYDDLRTMTVRIQYAEEPFRLAQPVRAKGDNPQITHTRTLYTNMCVEMEAVLNFMYPARRNLFSWEQYVNAVENTLFDTEHNQLSKRQIAILGLRMELQRRGVLFVDKIEQLNITDKKREMPFEEYNAFLESLFNDIVPKERYEKADNKKELLDTVEFLVKAYYHITKTGIHRSKKDTVNVYARYNKSFERMAAENIEQRRKEYEEQEKIWRTEDAKELDFAVLELIHAAQRQYDERRQSGQVFGAAKIHPASVPAAVEQSEPESAAEPVQDSAATEPDAPAPKIEAENWINRAVKKLFGGLKRGR